MTAKRAMIHPRWIALIVLTAARAAMGFQFQAPASLAPLLSDGLALSSSGIGILIGLYMLPGIALAFPGALLGQRFGDRRVVATGLILMAAGGALASAGENQLMLFAGRLLSGIGAVLLNVLMTKMITDWFARREIILVMAVFMNAFPIGIGVALLTLGWLGESAGWPAAFLVTSLVSLAALAMLTVFYHQHPNDSGKQKETRAGSRMSRREIVLVALAGAIWGLYNGAFTTMLGFTPSWLVASGMSVGMAGFLVGLTAWLTVVSVQAGGAFAQRLGHADLLMLCAIGGWGAGLILLPHAPPAAVLIATGLFLGLPVGIIVAMPAEVLRPASRAAGMGVFFTGLYIGHALLPAVAGWIEDLTGSPAAPLYYAGTLVLAIAPVHGAFRVLQQRMQRSERRDLK